MNQTLKLTGIDTETWHEPAENRTGWRQAVKKGVRSFELERLKVREDKWQKCKTKEALEVQQNPSADFVCEMFGRACESRIGPYGHSTHPQQHCHHRNRWVHHQSMCTCHLLTVVICESLVASFALKANNECFVGLDWRAKELASQVSGRSSPTGNMSPYMPSVDCRPGTLLI